MAHCNTIFHQMLKLIPRHHFAQLETEHGTGRKARSFTRWSQLVHLLSMQLTARVSLRDAVSSLKARVKSLYHLGVKPVARSTFADANNQRPASFYEALFGLMYRRCQPLTPKHKFKFKNKLFSLDATVVSLCLSLYPLGFLPPHQGRHQATHPVGSRGLSAGLCGHLPGPGARNQEGPQP